MANRTTLSVYAFGWMSCLAGLALVRLTIGTIGFDQLVTSAAALAIILVVVAGRR